MASNCMESLVVWTMASHLKWFNIVAEYALFVLVAYLTDAWGLGSAHAAGIINIWTGFSKLLTLLGAFMVDNIGNYQMLLCSSILYSIGLAFLYMSTPPVLANMAGNCSHNSPECFGPTQKAMFYISLVLTCLGTAGHTVSLDPFLDEQSVNVVVNKEKAEGDNNNEKNAESCCSVKNVVNNLMRVVISGVSSWFLPDNWGKRFAIVAIYGFVATISFAIGTKFYKTKKEGGTKINFCHMFHQTSLVWPSFIMCGVVSSIGNTFFVEQADRMRPVAGVYTVPLGILLLLANTAKFILKYCYQFIYTLIKQFFTLGDRVAKKYVKGVDDNLHIKEMAALVGLGIAMLNAVLCCLSAAVVENVRRKDTMKKYLHHDSKFWLVPQFVFVIGIDAFLQESVKDFFENYGPFYKSSKKDDQDAEEQSMEKYIIQFTNFVIGLGFIGSVVSVLAVAKISQSVTGKSWIKREVNDSHLEKYYWVLSVLSGINIIYYVVGAICYSKKISKKKEDAAVLQKNKEKSGCCPC